MAKGLVYYGAQHLTHLPQTIRRVREDPEQRRMINQLGILLKSDILPIILVGGSFDLLQQQIAAWQGDDSQEDASSWDARALLRWGLVSLQLGIHVFNIRKMLALRAHMIFYNANMGKILAKSNSNYALHTEICKSKECSFLRVSQGLVRDIVSYILTDLSLSELQLLGLPPALVFTLRAMNEGRFVLSMFVAGCNREQSTYAAQNPGLVLAIGLGYTVPLELMVFACRQAGLPMGMVSSPLCQIFLVTESLIVSNFKLPKPRGGTEDSMQWGDPVGFIQWCIGWGLDTFLLGFKQKMDRACKKANGGGFSTLNSDLTVLQTKDIIKQLFWLSYWICSPKILRNKKAIMSDPIAGPYLKEVLEECLPGIETIEALAANHKIKALLQILVISPKKSSDCIRTFYNLPAPLILGVLHLIKQGHFYERVAALREFLESFLLPEYVALPPSPGNLNVISTSRSSKEIAQIQAVAQALSRVQSNPAEQAKTRAVARGFFDSSVSPARSRSTSPQLQEKRFMAASFFENAPDSTEASFSSESANQRELAVKFFG